MWNESMESETNSRLARLFPGGRLDRQAAAELLAGAMTWRDVEARASDDLLGAALLLAVRASSRPRFGTNYTWPKARGVAPTSLRSRMVKAQLHRGLRHAKWVAASWPPRAKRAAHFGDSTLAKSYGTKKFDLVLSSPPYLSR